MSNNWQNKDAAPWECVGKKLFASRRFRKLSEPSSAEKRNSKGYKLIYRNNAI